MDIKDIALFAREGAPCAAQVSLAARLAHVHGARVAGVCLLVEPELPICDSYAIGREAVVAVLEDRDRAARASVAPIEIALRQAAAEHDCGLDWTVVGPDEPLEASALRARFADLVIVRRPPQGDGPAFDLASALMLASGTPCLVVPDTARTDGRFDRVLVAWNGSRDAKRALDDGLALLLGASAVKVLIIDGEAAAETDAGSVATLFAHLARHGVHAELKRLRKAHEGVGKAILQEAETSSADLLIMGAYGHSRTSEAVFGGATRTVLSHAPIPVLMSH